MSERTPDWEVTSVFDPDGEGHDFAYTVGLHDRGLPELHIWGRPSLGDDPGADWLLSPADRCRILNDAAWRLIDGRLAVGDTWESRFDAGHTRAGFRLDPPGDRDELEAYGIAPGADVLPVRWSLHRAPVGRPRPLTKRGLQRASSEYAALVGELGESPRLPDGGSLPPSFVPGGPFGPLTPMVTGRVAEFWAADATALSNLLWAEVTADQGGWTPSFSVAVAAAVAREVGRVAEVDRTLKAATGVIEARLALPDWPDLLSAVYKLVGFQPDEATIEQFGRSFERRTTEMLWTVLATEVVADRLTRQQRLEGRGTWVIGLAPAGELPGRPWCAPRAVIDRLLAALWPLGFEQILVLIRRHEDEERVRYQELSQAVHGWSIVSAAGCPWRGALDRLPGAVLPGRITSLQEWATIMTSASCHRDRLTSADVADLCAPFLDLVPDLPAVLNG